MPGFRLHPLLRIGCILSVLACDGPTVPWNRADPPVAMTIASGDNQQAAVDTELPDPLIIVLVDARGRALSGHLVRFHVVSGGGSLTAELVTTNSAGAAATRWRLGPIAHDTQRIQASLHGVAPIAAPIAATFKAVGTPDAAAAIQKASADSGSAVAGSSISPPPRVRVTDRHGNGVPGTAVTFTVTGGGGSVVEAAPTTDQDGFAEVGGWTLGTDAGLNTLSATASGVTGSAEFTANGTPGGAALLAIAHAASGAQSGMAFVQQPTIRITDIHGNVVTDAVTTVTVTAVEAVTILGARSVAAVGGIASFTDLGLGGTEGTYTLVYQAVLGDAVRSDTQTVVLTPGEAAQLAFEVQPPNGSYLIPFPPVSIAVLDGYGNRVTNGAHDVTLTLSTHDAVLGGGSSRTSSAGLVTFYDLTVDRGGQGYTLVASSPGLLEAESSPFDVSAVAILSSGTPYYALHVAGSQLYTMGYPRLSDGGWHVPYVHRGATTGGPRTTLWTHEFPPATPTPFMFSDGSHLHFVLQVIPGHTRYYHVMRAPLMGGSAEYVFSRGGPLWWLYGMVYDSEWFVMSANDPLRGPESGTFSVSLSTGSAVRLFEHPFSDMAVSHGRLYYLDYLDGYTIKSVPITGGTPTTVVTGATVAASSQMLVVRDTIYWGGDGSILSAPISGGSATIRAQGLGEVRNMVSDGLNLYVNVAGTLRRYDLGTFEETRIAPDDGAVGLIAVDEQSVYWISGAGSSIVKKARK